MYLASLRGQNTKKHTKRTQFYYEKIGIFFMVVLFSSVVFLGVYIFALGGGGVQIFWGYADFDPEALVCSLSQIVEKQLNELQIVPTLRATTKI